MSSVCRVCLAGNMRVKILKNKLLEDLYAKLSTTKFNSEDARPKVLCSSCYQKLLKCHTFSQMAHRSERIFNQLFQDGLEATQDNITQMNPGINQHLSVATTQIINIDGKTTHAGCQVTIKDEPISSIDIKEETTIENDRLVEIYSAEDCIQRQFPSEDNRDQGNDTGKLPLNNQVGQTQRDGSRTLMEPSSFNACDERLIHTGKKSFVCNVCDKLFLRKASLVNHKKTHTRKKLFACNVCDKQFRHNNSLVYHKKTHTAQKRFTCDVCGKQYKHKHHLGDHMRLHTEVNPFSCNVCGTHFDHRRTLDHHKKTHTEENPFACNVCDKQLTNKYSLNVHMRIHTGEKPLACNVCGKQFRHRGSLVYHEKAHTGEKPFSCNECDKQFHQKSLLLRHMSTHTGEKPYACNICDKQFIRHHSLVIHMYRC